MGAPLSSARLFNGSLDAEKIRVKRLAAVMDLGGEPGPVLRKPFDDAAGVGRVRPLALDNRHYLEVPLFGTSRPSNAMAASAGPPAAGVTTSIPGGTNPANRRV